MTYQRHKMQVGSDVRVAPKPQGMSGGGLFRFDSLRDMSLGETTIIDKLVGIMIEYHENRSVIVATNIAFALTAIRKAFPTLASSLPTSKTIQLSFGPSS